MLRSLMTAVTGVKAHQVMLDATGNNIANVNTTGFKRDFVIFQDLLYQTSQGATGPGDQRGGVNPAQVGLGVRVGAIETIHTQGYFQFTGNKNDMMIDGEGYFVFRDGTSRIYSRAGNFVPDGENNLVHSGTGYYVQGYEMVRDPLNPTSFIEDSTLTDINLPMGETLDARGTTVVGYKGNLDSDNEPYLPIGYAGIPSTTSSRETQVLINDIPYTMSLVSNLGGMSAANYHYFTVKADLGGGNAMTINMDMTGVTSDGTSTYPTLTLTATDGIYYIPDPDGKYQASSASASGYELAPPDGNGSYTQIKVEYNNTDGRLQFKATSGATLWKTNLHESMSYKSFTVGTGSDARDFLVEFNEAEGLMDDSPIEMVVWWTEATTNTTPPSGSGGSGSSGDPFDPDVTGVEETNLDTLKTLTVKKMVYDVYMNADGTFDNVELRNGASRVVLGATAGPAFHSFDGNPYETGATSNPIDGLDEGETGDYDYFSVAGGYMWGNDLGIAVASGGRSLEIRKATAPNPDAKSDATPALSETVDTITQGQAEASKMTIYDCQGKEYTLEVEFKKLTGNRWRWEASLPGQEKMVLTPSSGELIFDDSCHLVSPLEAPEVTIDFGMNFTSFQTIKLDFSGQSFGLDPSQGVTQFSSDSTAKGYIQDGYEMGTLNDYSTGNDGVIMGKYTNGQNLPVYRVALAQFANPMGLEKVGDSMFRETINSGLANINPAQVAGGGSIKGGNLEMSNVDLTEEFTRLIISQRGFQANTRVVTTSDQILEEVVNLKR